MNKNYYLWLLLLIFAAFFSCRNEEVFSSLQQNMKYTSKSPWKEDEVYIKNVKSVFEKYTDMNFFENKYGQVYWDYAMSFGKFDESFMLVPLVKNNSVVTAMKVIRVGDRIFLYEQKDYYVTAFFDGLLNLNLLGYFEKKENAANGISNKLSFSCTYRTITVGCFENQTDCSPISRTVSSCSWVEDGDNGGRNDQMEIYNDDSAGGGGYDGLPYPEEKNDPCVQIQSNFSNTSFAEKFENLTDSKVFDLDHEKGSFERYPPKDSGLKPSFVDIENKIGTTNMDLPDDKSGVVGLMHSHNNEDADGNHPIKIFSPTDIRTFINHLLPQSNYYTGSYTNAYSVVTTSEGNYMLKYTKETWPGSIGYDTKEVWQKWYKDNYTDLLENGKLTQGNVEKLFTQFLKEVVKIDGLEVYKVTENSSAKLEYNGVSEPVKSTNCN